MTLILFVAVALGASGALALTAPGLPSPLRSADPLREVAVSERDFDDERTVEVSLEVGAERQLSSPRAGTVTETLCRQGVDLASGKRLAAVDGQGLVGLATSQPLWRDIRDGDRGDDVRALQGELVRLGRSIDIDGIAGVDTLSAAATVLGEKAGIELVPFASFVWLPSPTVSPSSCPASLGGTIEVGQPLAMLPVALTGMRVTSLPAHLVAGPRTLLVGGTHLDLSPGGAISDPTALASVAGLPEFANAIGMDGEPTITGTLSLKRTLRIFVVPPPALFALRGASACVASDGIPIPVEVVGSELGEAFVVPRSGRSLSHVDLSGDARSCS